jgi:hypothetical protein
MFIGLAKEFRGQAQAMGSEYPPWVAGKIRDLIVNLRIV